MIIRTTKIRYAFRLHILNSSSSSIIHNAVTIKLVTNVSFWKKLHLSYVGSLCSHEWFSFSSMRSMSTSLDLWTFQLKPNASTNASTGLSCQQMPICGRHRSIWSLWSPALLRVWFVLHSQMDLLAYLLWLVRKLREIRVILANVLCNLSICEFVADSHALITSKSTSMFFHFVSMYNFVRYRRRFFREFLRNIFYPYIYHEFSQINPWIYDTFQ